MSVAEWFAAALPSEESESDEDELLGDDGADEIGRSGDEASTDGQVPSDEPARVIRLAGSAHCAGMSPTDPRTRVGAPQEDEDHPGRGRRAARRR